MVASSPAASTPGTVSRRFAVVMLIVVVLAWGFAWPVHKLILLQLPPIWAVALRCAVGTIAMFAITAALGRLRLPPRQDLPIVFSIALLHMTGFAVLSSIGLQLVSTGRSVVLAYTVSLWVVPGARLFLGEPITPRRAAGALMGLSGLILLFNPASFDWRDGVAWLGNTALLASAFCWAASILHLRGHRWHSDTFDLVPWELLVASVIMLIMRRSRPGPTSSGAPSSACWCSMRAFPARDRLLGDRGGEPRPAVDHGVDRSPGSAADQHHDRDPVARRAACRWRWSSPWR